MAAPAAADGGGAWVLPAAVHVQVRRLQPVLPGARGRAAGRAGDHGVLPGGVAVQVRQPSLHALNPRISRTARRRAETPAWPAGEPVQSTRTQPALVRSAGRALHYCTGRPGSVARLRCCCCARCRRGPRRARAGMGGISAARAWWRPTTHRPAPAPGDTDETVRVSFFVTWGAARWNSHGPTTSFQGMASVRLGSACWIEEGGDELLRRSTPATVRILCGSVSSVEKNDSVQVLIYFQFPLLSKVVFGSELVVTELCGLRG